MSNVTPLSDARCRVLVVDDDPVFTGLATSCLQAAGYETATACDGVEALELLQQRSFDLAMIDLAMPRVDGFRLIGMMRSWPSLSRLAIMVISSRSDVEAFEEAYALGANAFQTKPINWELLPLQVRFTLRETQRRPVVVTRLA